MLKKQIIYFRNDVIVACDGKCNKAWGIQLRLKKSGINKNGHWSYDDFKNDKEMGFAPIDPGTYEEGDSKPISKLEFPNKWCVRECERSELYKLDEKIKLNKF